MMYQKLIRTEESDGVILQHFEGMITGFCINSALKKQAEQLDWYTSMMTPEKAETLRKHIAEKTNIPEDLDGDEEIPISTINRYVPRGVAIESLYLKLI